MTVLSAGSRLHLKPLKALWCLLLASHLGGLLVLGLSAAPVELFCIALVLVLCSLGELYRRFFYTASRVSSLVFSTEQCCYLIQADGEVLAVELCGGALITPWLTILHFSSEQGKRSVILTADSVDAEEFRRLRVRLNAQAQAEVQ